MMADSVRVDGSETLSSPSRQIPNPPLLPPFFPTTRTSSMTQPLSTTLHISTTVSAAPTTPVNASISTPVFAVVSTCTEMRTPPYSPIGEESCEASLIRPSSDGEKDFSGRASLSQRPTGSRRTMHPSTGTPPCARGMRSLVFLTAWTAAMRATAKTSPFLTAF